MRPEDASGGIQPYRLRAFFRQGWTTAEIANMTGISEDDVCNILAALREGWEPAQPPFVRVDIAARWVISDLRRRMDENAVAVQ